MESPKAQRKEKSPTLGHTTNPPNRPFAMIDEFQIRRANLLIRSWLSRNEIFARITPGVGLLADEL